MTDNQGDPDRRPTGDSGRADDQPVASDVDAQTGLLDTTDAGPTWTQDDGTNAEPASAEPEMSPAFLK